MPNICQQQNNPGKGKRRSSARGLGATASQDHRYVLEHKCSWRLAGISVSNGSTCIWPWVSLPRKGRVWDSPLAMTPQGTAVSPVQRGAYYLRIWERSHIWLTQPGRAALQSLGRSEVNPIHAGSVHGMCRAELYAAAEGVALRGTKRRHSSLYDFERMRGALLCWWVAEVLLVMLSPNKGRTAKGDLGWDGLEPESVQGLPWAFTAAHIVGPDCQPAWHVPHIGGALLGLQRTAARLLLGSSGGQHATGVGAAA